MKKLRLAIQIIFVVIVGGGIWYFSLVDSERRVSFSLSKEVSVIEDGLIVLGAKTQAKTVGDFLEGVGFDLQENDILFPTEETEIIGGMRVNIWRAIPVRIEVDDKVLEERVFANTVGQALRERGIVLNEFDKVEPTVEENIFPEMKIVVTRIEQREVVEREEIDFEVIEKKDKKLSWRKKKIKQEGKKGLREVRYLVIYKNGKEVERKKISTEIIRKPQDEIIVMGTKIKVGKVQKGLASWYAYTGKMAAASTTFPKGTWLRVTAVNSGRQVIVVVNDYGPDPSTGKIIDLDKEAFKKLAPLGAGVIEVKIEEIK